MSQHADLICPKCGADWRAYERNNVTVDQCTGCRGVFLDRGELERLIDAESSFYEGSGERREERRDRDDRDERRQEKPRKSKKKSFLESIMEMGEG